MSEEVLYAQVHARHQRGGGPPVGFLAADDGDRDDVAPVLKVAAIERPRERMVAFGPTALSNVELVALLLGGGHAERRALVLLQQVGGLRGLLRCLPSELLQAPGVGEASATAVCAAVELARRIGQLDLPFETPVHSPQDVHRYVRASLRGRGHEVLMVLGLDPRQRVRLVREVAAVLAATSELQARAVFRPLVQGGASAVIVVHHLPGALLEPSPADITFARRLSELGAMLGVPVLDFLVVHDDGCLSLTGLGLLPVPAGAEP